MPGAATREALVSLGLTGKPRPFLHAASAWLTSRPDDDGVRLLVASNLGRLGMRTAALAQLALVRGEPARVEALHASLGALPDDRSSPEELVATARANIEALAARGLDLRHELRSWTPSGTIVRTRDGVPVRLERDLAELVRLMDAPSGAAERIRAAVGADAHTPLVIEGADPPWLLLEAWRQTPPAKNGHQPRIDLVQASLSELIDGLSMIDLREALSDPRVTVHVGPGAALSLRASLEARSDFGPPRVVLREAVRVPAEPPLDEELTRFLSNLERRNADLAKGVAGVYGPRDAAWYGRRLDRTDDPPRVVVLTSRSSTVLRHAAAGLVGALSRAGCDATLVMEPDPYLTLSSVGVRRMLIEREPDLLIVPNFPRRACSSCLPANLPYVCWLQDSMPRIFDASLGRRQGEMDFMVGCLFIDLFEHFGYPMRGCLPMPMVADPAVFHRGPISAEHARRYECEVAMASRHSETPEEYASQLLGRLAVPSSFRAAVVRAMDRATELALSASTVYLQRDVRAACREELARAVPARDAESAADMVFRGFALPMADRVLRHQALAWAAAVCERRGWRLHLYGDGWERHATLGRYARGEVPHGEELRACYRAARVHLHVSATTLVHQRVLECALSGGLPACRLHLDGLGALASRAWRRVVERGVPDSDLDIPVRSIPELAEADRLRALLGAERAPSYRLPRSKLAAVHRLRGVLSDQEDASWLVGDLAERSFWDEASLERLVERGISDGWRHAVSAEIAHRVRDQLTTDVLARRILDLVRSGLRDAARPLGAAA